MRKLTSAILLISLCGLVLYLGLKPLYDSFIKGGIKGLIAGIITYFIFFVFIIVVVRLYEWALKQW